MQNRICCFFILALLCGGTLHGAAAAKAHAPRFASYTPLSADGALAAPWPENHWGWGLTVTLIDTKSGKAAQVLKGHAENVDDVVFAPAGRSLVTVSHYGELILWDADTGAPRLKLKRKERSLDWFPVAYTPDGKTLAVGGLGTGPLENTHTHGAFGISLWDTQTGRLKRILTQAGETLDEANVERLGFCPDGKTLVAQGGFGGVYVRTWNIQTGRLIRRFVTQGSAIGAGVGGSGLSPDGSNVAVQGRPDNLLLLYNPLTGAQRTLLGHAHRVWSVFFSPNGKTMASVGLQQVSRGDIGGDETVELCLWDVPTGRLLRTLGPGQVSPHVLFSPDSRSMLVYSAPLKLYDVRTGAVRQTLDQKLALLLFFGPDSKLISMADPARPVDLPGGPH